VVGRTLSYLAPELANPAQRASAASDLFAFGLTLFDVLTAGQVPTKRASTTLEAKQLTQLDSTTRDVVERLTSCDPPKRPTATVALSMPLFRSASSVAVMEVLQPQRAPQDDIERVRQDLIDKLTECCLCMDAPKDCLVSPCRHLAMCLACADSLIQCPICQSAIVTREKVFLT
jgi:serine/threonine protein kinase